MKIIESREHELLSSNPATLEPANESRFGVESLQPALAADAALAGICGAHGATDAANPPGGWSPYEVWRTRVSRLARPDEPRPLP